MTVASAPRPRRGAPNLDSSRETNDATRRTTDDGMRRRKPKTRVHRAYSATFLSRSMPRLLSSFFVFFSRSLSFFFLLFFPFRIAMTLKKKQKTELRPVRSANWRFFLRALARQSASSVSVSVSHSPSRSSLFASRRVRVRLEAPISPTPSLPRPASTNVFPSIRSHSRFSNFHAFRRSNFFFLFPFPF